MTNKTRYLVVGLPRSGTTVVHLGIMGHPNVAAFSDEIHIKPFFDLGVATFSFGSEHDEERREGRRRMFDALASLQADQDTTHLGIKVCAQTVEQANILVQSLTENLPEIKVVLTVRSDLVATYGSLCNARRSGIWHSWNDSGRRAGVRKQRRLSPFMFSRFAVRSLQIIHILHQLRKTHDVFEFEYERLLGTSPETIWEELFSSIGLPTIEPTWLEAKKVMPPPQRFIENYDHLTNLQDALGVQVQTNRIPRTVQLAASTLDRLMTLIRGFQPGEDRRSL